MHVVYLSKLPLHTTNSSGPPRSVDAQNAGLAFTRYCHHQYCYGVWHQKGGSMAGVYCAMVVQYDCNIVGNAGEEWAIKKN